MLLTGIQTSDLLTIGKCMKKSPFKGLIYQNKIRWPDQIRQDLETIKHKRLPVGPQTASEAVPFFGGEAG